MRPATFLAALGLFLGVASAAPQSDTTTSISDGTPACFSELECSGILDLVIPEVNTPTPVVERELTNAARLARGLPLKAPHRRFSPSRVVRAAASPSVTARGRIRVDRADGTGNLGYFSKHPFSAAQHRYQAIDNAMTVNFIVGTSTVAETQIDINTEDSDIQMTYPRLSLVQGRDDTDSNLKSGSFQYAYIAGSDATAPGAAPQDVSNSYSSATGTARTAESAVWSYDPSNQHITPIWINSDGNAAPTNLFTQSTALYVSGDSGSFVSRYPSPIIPIVFVFEPLGV